MGAKSPDAPASVKELLSLDKEKKRELSPAEIAQMALGGADDEELEKEIELLLLGREQTILYNNIKNAITNYRPCCKKYSHINQFSLHDIEIRAKTECALNEILKTAEDPAKRNEYFKLLKEYGNHFELDIPISTSDAFRKFLDRVVTKGFPKALIHGGFNKEGNALKINEAMNDLLVLLAADRPHGVSAEYIKDDLDGILDDNEELTKSKTLYRISSRSISDFMLRPEAVNAISFAKDNINAFRKKVFGILRFKPPKNKLVRISIDGYVFQVVCDDDDGSGTPIQLVGVFIRDDKTRAILGLAIGETENHELLLEALREYFAVAKNRAPHEIVMDKHSSHLCKYLKNFISTLERDGVNVITSKNPDRKGTLERFFLTLQLKILSYIFSYIGPGIKSKATNAHPDRTFLMKVKSRSYLSDMPTMKRTLSYFVRKYYNNEYIARGIVNMPPMHEFSSGPSGHLKEYPEEMVAYMSYDHHKTTVEGCGIMIEIKAHLYLFKKRSIEIAEQLNTIAVDAFISPDKKKAYLFKRGEREFFCDMDFIGIIPVSEVERTEQENLFMKMYSADTKKLISIFEQKMINRFEATKKVLNKDYREVTKKARLKKQADTDYEGFQIGISKPKEDVDDPAWFDKTSLKKKKNKREKNLGIEFGNTID